MGVGTTQTLLYLSTLSISMAAAFFLRLFSIWQVYCPLPISGLQLCLGQWKTIPKDVLKHFRHIVSSFTGSFKVWVTGQFAQVNLVIDFSGKLLSLLNSYLPLVLTQCIQFHPNNYLKAVFISNLQQGDESSPKKHSQVINTCITCTLHYIIFL